MRSDFKMRTDATRILRVPRLRSNRVSDAEHRETHVNLFLGVPKRFRRDLSGRDCMPRSLRENSLASFVTPSRGKIINVVILYIKIYNFKNSSMFDDFDDEKK